MDEFIAFKVDKARINKEFVHSHHPYFSVRDWALVLDTLPGSIVYIDINTFPVEDIIELMDYCKEFDVKGHTDFKRFSPSDWVRLVSFNAGLKDRCPFHTFGPSEWALYLLAHPADAHKCNWNLFGVQNLTMIAKRHPQLLKHFTWDTFDKDILKQILAVCHDAIHYIDVGVFDKEDIAFILKWNPKLKDSLVPMSVKDKALAWLKRVGK